MDPQEIQGAAELTATHTLGVVSYLNARPLYASLSDRPEVSFEPAVPSRLVQMLLEGRCDTALLPVVDFYRNRSVLEPVSDACIACNGETMTVRVFSKGPADKVSRLHVDGDSKTSVILANIIWREIYDRKLEIIPWQNESGFDGVESILLIGDKVVTGAPAGFGFEADLGAAWKYLTNLPFVFAAWYGRKGRVEPDLAAALNAARDRGESDAEAIALRSADEHGWPEDAAIRYLTKILKFRLTPEMNAGMARFFELAEKHKLLP